jgi:hypothetical protein
MPKIQWERLPKEKWSHLRDRAKERKISEENLFALAEWKAQDPDTRWPVVRGLRPGPLPCENVRNGAARKDYSVTVSSPALSAADVPPAEIVTTPLATVTV